MVFIERRQMAVPTAAVVVKKIRVATRDWAKHAPTPAEALKVKELVELLPAFRNAPQTKTENTLRAIEALYKAHLQVDPTKKSVEVDEPGLSRFEVAVGKILNVHHGVKEPVVQKKVVKKKPPLKAPPLKAEPMVLNKKKPVVIVEDPTW